MPNPMAASADPKRGRTSFLIFLEHALSVFNQSVNLAASFGGK